MEQVDRTKFTIPYELEHNEIERLLRYWGDKVSESVAWHIGGGVETVDYAIERVKHLRERREALLKKQWSSNETKANIPINKDQILPGAWETTPPSENLTLSEVQSYSANHD